MENAKHSAQIRQIQVKDDQQENRLAGHDTRLDTVEGDIERIADHAWKEISQCGVGSGSGGTGYKIIWNPAGSGTWGCIQETDPTVKAFAKTNLPNCGAGQVLRADGNSFSCTTSAGTSGFEVDPYVQDFARNTVYTINACASDEILTMTNKRLRCVKSKDLSITETDPTVQPFAKATLPACAAGQVLTSAVNGSGVSILKCVTDTDGGYAELDPSVGTITNNKWCMASGGKIQCNQNPPVLTEVDPKVGALTNARWCRAVSSKIVCDQVQPTGDNLGNHTATANLNMANRAITADVGTIRDASGGWVRTYGATGWYNQTHGGGWYMSDATYLRNYGSKLLNVTVSSTGAAITGQNNGAGYGVVGQAASTYGVYGKSTSASYGGVLGYTANGSIYGILGHANAYSLYGNGPIQVGGKVTATAYYQSSDRNLKENIKPISNPFALLNAIEGKHYTWKASKKPAYGVIAQDVEKVMPEAVQTTDSGTKTVEYSQLIAPMLEAIKQLESRVQELEGKKKGNHLAQACPPNTFCLMNIGAQ